VANEAFEMWCVNGGFARVPQTQAQDIYSKLNTVIHYLSSAGCYTLSLKYRLLPEILSGKENR